ncbi:MAG: ABC transporter permease [Desulfobacterales bacterium]|nr:ABC transporter permease [Desulfobacterales bacterium]
MKWSLSWGLPWILPIAALGFWILVGAFNWLPSYLLPPPLEVAQTGFVYIFGTPGEAPYAGRFLSDAIASLYRVCLGFLLASVLGLVLGILSGRVSRVRQMLGTSVNGLRAVPGITWLPLAMVWFGIGLKTTVFLVAMAAFFPIYLNAADGAARVSPTLLQAGAMMGVDRIRGTFAILLPAAMPSIVTGLRLGLGISWAYLVLGELSGVPDGLGAVIMDARMLGRIDMIVVGICLIAIMGRITDLMLKAGLKFCFKSAARMT